MKPSPLSALDIPKDWPKHGTKPNGDKIDLREAWATMSYVGIAMIEVDVPGKGKITPWSNVDYLDGFVLEDGDEGLMSREDLESNGSSDAKLEAWAAGKGIRLSLSGHDTPDLQHIRADAYARYIDDRY